MSDYVKTLGLLLVYCENRVDMQSATAIRAVLEENKRLKAQIDSDAIGHVNVRKAKNEVIKRMEAALLQIKREWAQTTLVSPSGQARILKALRGEK